MKKKIALLTGALLLAISASSAQAHSRSWFGFFTHHHHNHHHGYHHHGHHGSHGHHYGHHKHGHHEPGFIW